MANEAAHRTRYSVCATSALFSDWEPLMGSMAEIVFALGPRTALE